MPQPRIHASGAARAAAYRARKRAREHAAGPATNVQDAPHTPEPTATPEVRVSQDSATIAALTAVEREIRLLRHTVDGIQP